MKNKVLLSVLVVVFVAIATVLIIRFMNSPQAESEVKTVTYSTKTPSEHKPGDDYEWSGHREDPRKIIINSLGINGYVQRVGVDQNGQVAVPDNIFMAGWFVDSVRPGASGLSIIDGHIDGATKKDAIFGSLPNIQLGDEIRVEFGDDSFKIFRAIAVHDVKTEEAHGILFSQNPQIKSQLNLITCVGNFNDETESYDRRFIVEAELI